MYTQNMDFSSRDRLFIDRMSAVITTIERQKCKDQHFFIRPNGRKVNNATVLEHVFILLQSGCPWKFLHYVTQPKGIHYQTIYNRFSNWIKLGVLEEAWQCILKKYVHSRLSSNAKHFQHLYIDTTTIKNIGGIDCVGRNPTDRGRLGTKISAIIDDNKISVSKPVPYPANRNDVITLEETYNNIPLTLMTDRRRVTKLAADKAYRCEPTFLRMINRRVRIVTHPKKNERNPRPMRRQDHSMYKKRVRIEHYFGISKKCRRLRNRVDWYITTYVGFWYISNIRRMINVLSDEVSNIDHDSLMFLID
jgi:transposase